MTDPTTTGESVSALSAERLGLLAGLAVVDEEAAAPAADAAGNGAAAPAAITEGAAAGAVPAAAGQPRPDWIPEKFWDAAKGEPRVEALAKSYREAEKAIARRWGELGEDERRNALGLLDGEVRAAIEAEIKTALEAGRPKAPERYSLPEKLPDGVEALAEDDPLVAWAQGVFQKAGAPQEVFDEAVSGFLGLAQEIGAKQIADHQRHLDAEIKALGPDYPARRKAMTDRVLQIAGDPAAANQILAGLTTAKAFEAFERLLAAGQSPNLPGHVTAQADGPLTEEKIRAAMRDPRYLTDPTYIEQVSGMWRTLYPREQIDYSSGVPRVVTRGQ